MRMLIIMLIGLVVLTGCALEVANENVSIVVGENESTNNESLVNETVVVTDPLFCDNDDDCTYQATACNNCGCPEAVNVQNQEPLDCEPSEYACDLECPQTVPKCVDNTCMLVEQAFLDDPRYCETAEDCRQVDVECACCRVVTNIYNTPEPQCENFDAERCRSVDCLPHGVDCIDNRCEAVTIR